MKKRFILIIIGTLLVAAFVLVKLFAIKPPDWVEVGNERTPINFK